jgi:hypothetical protein
LLYDLDRMDPSDERFDAKVMVLMELVRHHVEDEENDVFPVLREYLGRKILGDLGEAMEAARQLAPTKPHPEAGDTPPRNVVMGAAVGVADRISDTVSGIAQGSVTAAGDIIDRVLRRERAHPAPTGSSKARRTATKVRSGAADATQAVVEATEATVRRTQEAVATTAETARASGKAAAKKAATTRSSTKRKAGKAARSKTKPSTSSRGKRPATKKAAKSAAKRQSRKAAARK